MQIKKYIIKKIVFSLLLLSLCQILFAMTEVEKDYVQKFIQIKNVKVGKGYGQFDVPGYSTSKKSIFGVVKNIGNKTVSFLEITIYFLDKNKLKIGEQSATLINTMYIFGKDSPLKPNYSKDFGISVEDNAPSEWSGKVNIEISKITIN